MLFLCFEGETRKKFDCFQQRLISRSDALPKRDSAVKFVGAIFFVCNSVEVQCQKLERAIRFFHATLLQSDCFQKFPELLRKKKTILSTVE